MHAGTKKLRTWVVVRTMSANIRTYASLLVVLAVKSSKIDMIVTKMIRWTNGTHVRRRPVHVTVAGRARESVTMNAFSIPRAIIIFARRVRFGLEAY